MSRLSKWVCPNERELEIARDRGLSPEGLVVSRTGSYLIFLELKTRRETLVCLYKLGKEAVG